jgi:heptosyltransferase-2
MVMGSGLTRILVVMPSWVGDVVMATPALRLIRRGFPGALIGGLMRPGLEELIEGSGLLDEVHLSRAGGVMGPKRAAAAVRPRRYEAAVLLTNSFSTALAARLAGIPRRVGYDRDLRGVLLTEKIAAPRRADGSWAAVPMVEYYVRLVRECLLGVEGKGGKVEGAEAWLELGVTEAQESKSKAILAKAGVVGGVGYAVLNPGGNNPAKRWPAARFAGVARWLWEERGMRSLVNGSPGEADLVREIVERAGIGEKCAGLVDLGMSLGALKGVVRGAGLMVTNDTGPRHLAAAFGVPLVTIFGPTDARWTTIVTRPGGPERVLSAGGVLPEGVLANDVPERCRVEGITEAEVREACGEVLG